SPRARDTASYPQWAYHGCGHGWVRWPYDACVSAPMCALVVRYCVSGWHSLRTPEHAGSLGCCLHCAQCLDQRLMVCLDFLWVHPKKGATQNHRIDEPLKLAELAAHLVWRARDR